MMNPLIRDYKRRNGEVREGVGKIGNKKEKGRVRHECGKERFFRKVRNSIRVPNKGLNYSVHVSARPKP